MIDKLKVGDIAFLDDSSQTKNTGNHDLIAVEIVGYRVRPTEAYILKELTAEHNINGSFNDNYFEHQKSPGFGMITKHSPLLSAKDALNNMTDGIHTTKFSDNSFVALAVLQSELGFENIKNKGLDSIVQSVSNSIKQKTQDLSKQSKAMRKWNEGVVFQTTSKIKRKLKERKKDREK